MLVVGLAVALQGAAFVPAAVADPPITRHSSDRIPGAYIVAFEDSVNRPGNLAAAQVRQRDGKLGFVYGAVLKGYSVSGLSKLDVEVLRRDPTVKSVMPDLMIKAAEGEEEECQEAKGECGPEETEAHGEGEESEGEGGEGGEQVVPPGVRRVFADQNEALDIDGVDDVRVDADVASVDSGIDIAHPDLNVVMRTNCVPEDEESVFTECVDNTGDPGNSHATHASGTIGAIDNGFGVVGVAPGVRLWSVRVLGNNNAGYWSWVIGGLNWVAEHAGELEVAHLNFSGGKAPNVEAVVSELVDEGIAVVAAAGNNQTNAISKTPASNPDTITTSGLADYDGKPGGEASPTCSNQGADDERYRYTNWGDAVDIAAPGTCVYSTVKGGGYEYFGGGTSFAGPHVAGAAAVLASQAAPKDREDVEQIRQTLLDEGSLNWSDSSEDGHIEPLLYLGDDPLGTEVATGPAAVVDRNGATLSGSVNPRGLETEYWFEYGFDTEYGFDAPTPVAELPSGTKYRQLAESIEGLEPSRLYHYRLVASNSSGTFYGRDKTFTSSSWRTQLNSAPGPSGYNSSLNDIACPTELSCVAIGHYPGGGPLIYMGSGDSWQVHSVPAPEEGSLGTLLDVSCNSAAACVAVGSGGDTSGHPKPISVRWDGNEWLPEEVPGWFDEKGGHKYSELHGVSCVSETECVAVGWYRAENGYGRNYSVLWDGEKWTKLSTPNPEAIEKSVLEDVSCPAPDLCVAVGWANLLAGGSRKVVMTWDGSSWSEIAPDVAGGGLTDVECVDAEYCITLGGGLAVEVWNGSTWSTQTMPVPTGATGGKLAGISCASMSYCVAVGEGYNASNGVRLNLAETWNGEGWHPQGTARESQSDVSVLGGVDCVRPGRCTATGWSWATGVQQPILETLTHAPIYQTSFGSKGTGNGQFNKPKGISVDDSGNVWVADNYNDRVEKFSPEGEYLGQFGATGSGNGQLDGPTDIAIDEEGNLWVTDSNNSRVQKFSPEGEYLDQFGSYGGGTGQFKIPSGISIAPNGHIWVSDYWLGRVSEFNASGEFVRNANPGFSFLGGLEVDSYGHVWVADWGHNRVVELSPEGAFLSEFGSSGEGDGQFKEPSAIAVLPSGMLLVVDHGTSRVQGFSPGGGYWFEFSEGQVAEPEGIAVGPAGEIYVANTKWGSVKKWIEPDMPAVSTEIATEVGEDGATLGGTVNPHGADTSYRFEYGASISYGSKVPASPEDIGSGAQAVEVKEPIEGLERATTYHHRVVATNEWGTTVGEDETFTTTAPTPAYQLSIGSKGSGNGQFERPAGIAIDAEGNLWVTDRNNDRVQKFSPEGEYLGQFGETGSGNGQLDDPRGVAIDAEGNLWVTDDGNDRVQKFSPEGEYLGQFGSFGGGDGQFKNPTGIAIDPNGHIWVVDYWLGRVSEFNASGEFVQNVTGIAGFSTGIAIDEQGHIWVADRNKSRVVEIGPGGEVLSEFGEPGEEDGQLKNPTAIGILPSGALLVADRFGGRVQEFSTEGAYVTQFGKGQLSEPEGMAVDSGGGIYIAHSSGHSVKKWIEPAAPLATTEAASEAGEGGATLNATVNPSGVETTYQFEYGDTAGYGSKAPASAKEIGSGTGGVEVSEAIEGLERATTYHYRVVATNEFGTTFGEDMTFTTSASTPEFQLSFGSKGSGNGQFESAAGLAIDAEDNLWVTDRGNDRVQKFSPEGEYLGQFGETGSGNGQLDEPYDVAIDAEGNLWVIDDGNDRVQKFSPEGEYLGQFGSFGSGDGQFKNPRGIDIGPDGHIWVSDYWLARVTEFNASGEFVQKVTPGFSWLGKLEVDDSAHVWVADRGNARVVELSPEGEVLSEFGSAGEENGQFDGGPIAVETTLSHALLVGERNSPFRVQVFSDENVYVTQFGKGQLGSTIEGIAVDSSGEIYVASAHTVTKWLEP